MITSVTGCVCVSEEIEWPEDEWAPPDDAQDLILKLLIHNPLDRLGVGGAQQVRRSTTRSTASASAARSRYAYTTRLSCDVTSAVPKRRLYERIQLMRS